MSTVLPLASNGFIIAFSGLHCKYGMNSVDSTGFSQFDIHRGSNGAHGEFQWISRQIQCIYAWGTVESSSNYTKSYWIWIIYAWNTVKSSQYPMRSGEIRCILEFIKMLWISCSKYSGYGQSIKWISALGSLDIFWNPTRLEHRLNAGKQCIYKSL
jgi:hypothetical protein